MLAKDTALDFDYAEGGYLSGGQTPPFNSGQAMGSEPGSSDSPF